MNRMDRLVSILLQLQTKRLVKAQEIADKFSISLRTVYRDVKALEEAGVPVIGEAGSGYQLMEGYRLPPVHFNQNEASALLTAGKLMQSTTDKAIAGHYNTALDKIRAVLRWSEKDHAALIDQHIAVVAHPTFVHTRPAELHLDKILNAISTSVAMQIRYASIGKGEQTLRTVEAIGIYLQGSHWYLVGWCRLRKDYRVFRTDKIEALVLTTEPVFQTHPSLQQFLEQTTEQRQLHTVVIEVDQEIMRYFGEQKYYNGFLKEEARGDKVRMTFLTSSIPGFARWYLLFGERATILQPESLKAEVAAIAQKVLEKLGVEESLLT
jgi:predicted DNA-binding transcriptional regulator YafY